MKTITSGFLAMALLTNAWAAKDADLTEFDGSYKGKGTATAPNIGQTFPLTAKVKFDVSKKGSTAKVTMSGKIMANSVVPWGTTIRLKRNRKLETSNFFAVEDSSVIPASGTYKLAKSSKLTGHAQIAFAGEVGEQDVMMIVKPQGKAKKTLDLMMIVLVNGQVTISFDMTLTGR